MKKPKLKIETKEQYEAACQLFYFLDTLELKQAWIARGRILRREGEHWGECDYCGEILGDHDDGEPCLDKDGNPRALCRYNEDDMER